MRIGVNGRVMDAASAPLVVRMIERMVGHGMQPQLSIGLATWLREMGIALPWPVIPSDDLSKQELDLCIGLGGDGTLLDTVAWVGRTEIPVLGINLGRLGFLSNVTLEAVEEALIAIKQGRYMLQDRSLLEVTPRRLIVLDGGDAIEARAGLTALGGALDAADPYAQLLGDDPSGPVAVNRDEVDAYAMLAKSNLH